ncbi:MAG: hypothetical protein AB7U42_07490 [Nocardioides sp.]
MQVDIPADWARTDMAACEFDFEQWAPPGAARCGFGGGVAFYASATFDPGHRPGVRRTDSTDEPAWGGYAYAGGFAIYASDDDRGVVRRILHSAR